MTREEEQLLFSDLSARLPYEVIVDYDGHEHVLDSVVADGTVHVINIIDNECNISEVKPYLRPMKSMTEKENNDLVNMSKISKNDSEYIANCTDYLLSHHLDYRGLIPKGLALEAPEGMYNVTMEEKK